MVGVTSRVFSRSIIRSTSSLMISSACSATFTRAFRLRLDHFTQIVDVVEEHAVQFIHRGLDVARHRDVDQEHGPVAARLITPRICSLVRMKCGAPLDAITISTSGSVHARIVVVDDAAVEFFGQRVGACARAIGHQDVGNTRAPQMPRGGFRHLPRPHTGPACLQRAEDLARQLHRGVAHRYRARADFGFGAHALGDIEARVITRSRNPLTAPCSLASA